MLSKEKQLKWEEYLYFKEKLGLHTCICEQMEVKRESDRSLDTFGASWTDLRLEHREEPDEWSIRAYGDDMAGVSIDYCPFCGRKLGE